MPPRQQDQSTLSSAELRKISLKEVREHNKASSGWVVIAGKVYDVTSYIAQHPGGRVLLSALGEPDSTDVFNAFHRGSKEANTKLVESIPVVGFLETTKEDKIVANAEFEKEYRELGDALLAEGKMNASPLYYAWKFLSTTAICVLSAWVTYSSAQRGSVWGQFFGAFLLALFWQQCGWLAHDFGHHQVFKSRFWNEVAILVVGNLYQGFSNEWWKNKHNTHHAVPNLLESAVGAHDGDPDIDTLPFLAWSKGMLSALGLGSDKPLPWQLRYQAVLYFPILFFARITWALQSAQFVYRFNVGFFENNEGAVREKMAKEVGAKEIPGLKYETAEKVTIALHYCGCVALCFGLTSSFAMGVAYFIAAQTVCGLLLAISFGVGHNGMAVVSPTTRTAYGELQVITTRNVENDFLGLTGWFMGGLHVQIEHHLYPAVPRHNLESIRPRVEALCKRHNVPYRSTTLWEGTVEVLQCLSDVVKDFPAA